MDETKCKMILKYYGEEHQKFIFVEELGELLQAIVKIWRYGDTKSKSAYIAELADVAIMIKQMQLALDAEEKVYFNEQIGYKLDRQLNRIDWERFNNDN